MYTPSPDYSSTIMEYYGSIQKICPVMASISMKMERGTGLCGVWSQSTELLFALNETSKQIYGAYGALKYSKRRCSLLQRHYKNKWRQFHIDENEDSYIIVPEKRFFQHENNCCGRFGKTVFTYALRVI